MADDVAITAGTGTAIATDEIGGRHFQLVKQAFGPVDTGTLVQASVGLPVQPQTGLGATPFPLTPGLKITEQCTRVAISFANAGDNQVVAADAANKIRIYGILLIVDAPVSVKLGEGGPTYWTGAMKYGAGGGIFLAQQGEPHFMTSAINKAFLINLSAAIQCSGVLWYTSVAP